ncbi:MAG: tRNA (adenosine(37)-N6)-dimethylallyltransferase MiaA [Chloroflexota bacterium]
MTTQPPLLVIVGQTAVGKTALSLELARRFSGEIISADSRLFYRGMDIGTAKPTPIEQAVAPHHMIDICNPDETMTLGDYQDRVNQIILGCHQRKKLPMLVGGTGQYVRAISEGWGIPRVKPHPSLRTELEKLSLPKMVQWLELLDPTAAENIDKQNPRRVIRALEVTLIAGIPISKLQEKDPPNWNILTIGLYRDREELYRRIDLRVDQMLEQGLEEEVRGLVAAGYDWSLPAMSGLGYRQFKSYFSGESTLEDVTERIKFETHRFARQQNNWFKRSDESIRWFNAATPHLEEKVFEFLEDVLSVSQN